MSIDGIRWPDLPALTEAGIAAADAHLAATEWLTPAALAAAQRPQLDAVLAHAAATVPHYRGAFDPRDVATVPVLTRAAIVAAGEGLRSQAYPASHGRPHEVATSRTTGAPVRVLGTEVVGALWVAITRRDHRWHRRDLTASLAAIRHTGGAAPPPDGLRSRGWGAATAALAPDAPMAVLSLASTTAEQVAWLRAVAPTYLITYPSALHAILAMLARDGRGLPTLREVRTVGETLSPATRGLCRDVLDLPIVDAYSAQEVGYVALQCPDAAPDDDPDGVRYHVQAERLLVEVLRDDGAPCAPGEIGRVVVTDLHNFATPLLRYELGDYAEVGPPCRCGRGLPVLRRIVGRTRNMLVYPDGRTVWPTFTIACRAASPYDAIQLVQERPDALRLRVVPDPTAGRVDHPALSAALRQCFGYPFAVTIEEVAALGRTPAGKLEEFISTLAPPR